MARPMQHVPEENSPQKDGEQYNCHTLIEGYRLARQMPESPLMALPDGCVGEHSWQAPRTTNWAVAMSRRIHPARLQNEPRTPLRPRPPRNHSPIQKRPQY